MTTKRPKKEVAPPTRDEQIATAELRFFDFHKTQTEIVPTPTRTFVLGEKCYLGNLNNCVVEKIYEGGKAYLVEHDTIKDRDRSFGLDPRSFQVKWWYEIEKVGTHRIDVPRLFTEYRHFPASNSQLDSLFHLLSHGGLVCDPDFQRDYVWSEENKDALLDSVFERLEIGSFTLIRHAGYRHKGKTTTKTYRSLSGELVTFSKENDYTVSIIDGQQRLTTLLDFWLDRRRYRGVLFSELHRRDQQEFESFSVQYRMIEEEQISKAELLRIFLQANRGVPQAPEHIARIQAIYDEEMKKNGNR